MLTNTNVLLAQEKKLHKIRSELTFMHKAGVKEMVVALCIVFDILCMFQAIDLYFTQKQWMSWIVTAALAFVLDVPPMLLGAATQNHKLSPSAKKLQILGLLSAFVLTYLGTFALRFASMDEMFPVVTLNIAGQTAEATEAGHTAGQYIMTLIMAIIPLGTSLCSFVLGMQDDPDEKYRHQVRMNCIALRQQIDAKKVMRAELANDMQFDREAYDKARQDIRLQIYHDQANILASNARKYLSEQIGSADAVTALMEDLQDSQEPQQETVSGHANYLDLTA